MIRVEHRIPLMKFAKEFKTVAKTKLQIGMHMLDEREGDVAPEELDQAFNRKTVWQRIAIVAASPCKSKVCKHSWPSLYSQLLLKDTF